MPPARSRSAARYWPPGRRSAMSGVRSLTVSKSSMVSGTLASRASASRCRTAFVEPPVAATPAIAFSNAARVRMSSGRRLRRNTSITSSPARRPTSSLRGSTAGTLALPMGERPMNSIASAIVFAVNCPPQAPGPGHAACSSTSSSSSDNMPAAFWPTPSKTSWMLTSWPLYVPGRIVPPYTMMPGMFSRASAIDAAGIVLSQPTRHTSASNM